MALFRNTEDMKLFVDVHKQTAWATLKPYVEQAEGDYIIPLLSEEQYNVFSSAMNNVANAAKTFSEIFTNAFDLECFNRAARSLANYAMFEALPILNAAVGDIGIVQQSSKEGTSTPAAQWRYIDRRNAHLNTADKYADNMLQYLELHKDYFTAWAASTSFTVNKDLFIADAKKLSTYLGTGESRRAYLALRSYIRLAEKKYIIPAIGKELFDEIKTQLKTTVSGANQTLLPMIEEALAWGAYYEGLPLIAIRITADGFRVVTKMEGVEVGPTTKEAIEERATARAQAGQNLDTFLSSLKEYMDDNADAYPLYGTSTASTNGQPRYTRPKNDCNSGHFRV